MSVVSNLTTVAGSAATTYITSSISPAANALILIGVISRFSGGTVNIPTASGNSLTWVQVATVLSSDNHSRLTFFRSLGASPSSGSITIDFNLQNQEFCNIIVDQITSVDISGTNGSGAVVQSATNQVSGGSTGLTVTLGAFSSGNNGTYGLCGDNGGVTPTPGGNFTTVGIVSGTNSEFASTNQTSVNWTWSSDGSFFQAVAIEVKTVSPTGFFAFL